MNNILESYLVGLGFSVDQNELREFQRAMQSAAELVKRETSGIVRALGEWQAGIVTAFAGISTAVAGLADHVAMADQSYRLFGERMLMTQDAARTLKMSMDALGQPLEVIAFDPETHQRFLQLEGDINALKKQLGPDFQQRMLAIRDLRFEFTRLRIALQFLSMEFVSQLFGKMGVSADDLRTTLAKLQANLPHLSEVFADQVVPILKDFWEMLKAIGGALKEAGTLFTNVVGLLSGDQSIEGASFNFEKLATAIQHVVHWGAMFVEWMTLAARMVLHLGNALTLALGGNFESAAKEFRAALQDLNPATGAITGSVTGSAAGALAGALYGLPGGPLGVLVGLLGGGTVGALGGSLAGAGIGAERQLIAPGEGVDYGEINATRRQNAEALRRIAQAFGIPSAIALAVGQQESGFNQNARSGAGAIGVMQLMPDTARTLGANPNNPLQNMAAGVLYLRELLDRYRGDIREALAAYNAGPGKVDAAIRSYGANWMSAMPLETQRYVPSVMARAQQFEINTHVSVAQTNASPHEIARAVDNRLRLHTVRDLAQLSPGY